MNKSGLCFFGVFVWCIIHFQPSYGQKESIERIFNESEALSHFRFLASDELKGRDAARPEIDIAAKYIAEQFVRYGADTLSTLGDVFQFVPLVLSGPPDTGTLQMGKTTFENGIDLLVLGGGEMNGTFELVAAGHGMEKDYEDLDVKGKVVVVRVGLPDKITPLELFAAGKEKISLARSKGAVGLIEMYNVPTTPWPLLVNYLNKTQLTLDPYPEQDGTFPYIWMKDLTGERFNEIHTDQPTTEIIIKGKVNQKILGRNVVAVIKGSDENLKEEYVMLSAHYDHMGVGRPNSEGDSIHNGARDNAVGTAALIHAAKYFTQNPPKRSILLCAWTAEEKGLLGSAYFAENPPVPLSHIKFNLNIDNAGYNDTSVITVIGLGRTSADHHITDAVAQFGLKAIPDPAPQQGLYDRSDNVNFAKNGIPAPTFSLGFTAFDEKVAEHYHQVTDQVDNFNLPYAILYWKSYILAAQLIANDPEQPIWEKGDKYEEAAIELYGTIP